MNEHKCQVAIEEQRRLFWSVIYNEALKAGKAYPVDVADKALVYFDDRFPGPDPQPEAS